MPPCTQAASLPARHRLQVPGSTNYGKQRHPGGSARPEALRHEGLLRLQGERAVLVQLHRDQDGHLQDGHPTGRAVRSGGLGTVRVR